MNKNIAYCALSAVGGMAVGGAASFFITKKVYRDRFDERLKVVEEQYNKMAKELAEKNANKPDIVEYYSISSEEPSITEAKVVTNVEPSITEIETTVVEPETLDTSLIDQIIKDAYEDNASQYLSDDISEDEGIEIIETTPKSNAPYLIDEDAFGELEDYNLTSLTYFLGDRYLVDDHLYPVERYSEVVGDEWWQWLRDNGGDVVYVRNDIRKCDYEIVIDYRCWNNGDPVEKQS